jgi:hypothetical protein
MDFHSRVRKFTFFPMNNNSKRLLNFPATIQHALPLIKAFCSVNHFNLRGDVIKTRDSNFT